MALQNYYLSIPELRLADRLSVRDLDIIEIIGRPYELTLTVTSSSDIDLLAALDKQATFSVCPVPETQSARLEALLPAQPIKPERQWGGVIRAISKISQSHDEFVFSIKMAPRLARLADDIDTRLYQNVDAPTLIKSILKDKLNLTGNDYVIKTSRPYVIHEHSTQYGERTLDYLNRICEAEGIYYFFTQTDDGFDVINFADDQSQYIKPVGVKLYRPDSGLESGWTEAVLKLQTHAKPVIGNFSFQDYNHRATLQADLQGNKLTQQGAKGFVGRAYQFGQHQKDTEQGNAAARLAYEIALNEQLTATGESTVLAFAPAQVFRTDLIDPQAEFGWVITEVRHTAGRRKAWLNEFKAIPSDRVIRLARTTVKPTISGTIPARITSPSKYTNAYLSEHGFYRVAYVFDADAKAGKWPPAGSSRLMRLARPYAGDTYGMHFPLIDGTEVQVAFQNGDIDRPYIQSALHDQSKPDHVTNLNHTRNVIRTPSNNKIRLEDKDAQQHIKISTEYGKSQLNLGHLVNAGREKRGEGFELRSDMAGVLRAEGLFFTAYSQNRASGQVLDMQPALDQLNQAMTQMQALAKAVETAQAQVADLQTQSDLKDQHIKELKAAVMLLAAPAGIALVTPDAIQHSAGKNVTLTAKNNIDAGAMDHVTVAAGKTLSLFAHQEGMKLYAAKGKVQMQAQSDELHINSDKDMQITSSHGQVTVAGDSKVTITSQGAYIKLEGGNVEIGGPGDLKIKTASFEWVGAGNNTFDLPKLPGTICWECLRRALNNGTPIIFR
ncbi:type VI secretion system secreted protein VgrG [Silvimonas terrae]|uniref:Type VI secretion system secreted protein VgrG n=1 Tax=Silvimonas terrae TaxID=300266 RepID=A0A840RE92_9NEIS|nr:type VI secretion system Vgr family protein [Silvimonas terrae]MBB5190622.1 type VI secretion system secreted protein VgrG [Silvimonas terrae]